MQNNNNLNLNIFQENFLKFDSKSLVLSFQFGFVFFIAVAATNLFHQGNWQRVYAAKNDKVLVKSLLISFVIIFVIVLSLGLTGSISKLNGLKFNEDLAFFSIILNKNFRDDITDIQKLPIMAADGKIVELGQVAYIAQENGRSKILHQGGKRIQTITADIDERDINDFNNDLKSELNKLKLNQGNYFEITGAAQANAKSQEELIVHSIIAGAGILLMLYIAFGNLRNLLLTLFNLPFALIGGVFAVSFNAGWISIGSLVGFVTLFGITLRNSIMLISHYQHLINVENHTWNLETCIKGASERLPSILMTAIVTALGLLPLALGSGQPGKEIEGPMASIIVGGLVTSTILNLLILPSIMLHFGKFEKEE